MRRKVIDIFGELIYGYENEKQKNHCTVNLAVLKKYPILVVLFINVNSGIKYVRCTNLYHIDTMQFLCYIGCCYFSFDQSSLLLLSSFAMHLIVLSFQISLSLHFLWEMVLFFEYSKIISTYIYIYILAALPGFARVKFIYIKPFAILS